MIVHTVTHELNFLLAEHAPKEKLFAITHLILWVSHDYDCENVLYDLQMKISETLQKSSIDYGRFKLVPFELEIE